MEELIDTKKRAYAGLAYAAFESLVTEKESGALELLGSLTKYLLADADIDSPPHPTQLTRLMEESLKYMSENETSTW